MKNKVFKLFAVVLFTLTLVSLMSVSVLALPADVIQVKKATEMSTRDPSWINTSTGILSLPFGQDFENGNGNHGAFGVITPVKMDQIFYVHWIVKVAANPDAAGNAILRHDPWFLSSSSTEGNVGSGEDLNAGLQGESSVDVLYEDVTPGKWSVISCGFQVTDENTTAIEQRLWYNNLAQTDIKYVIVTGEKLPKLSCDPATGEVNGITNNKPFTTQQAGTGASPSASPSATVQTTAAQTTTATATLVQTVQPTSPANQNATLAPTTTATTEAGKSFPLIIPIVIVILIAAGTAAFLMMRKKPR